MTGQVVIAEKKTLAEDIANALSNSVQRGPGYFIAGSVKVTYCSGHLLENEKPDEIDPRMAAWTLDNIPYIPSSWPMRPRSLKDESGRDIKKNGRVVLDERVVKQIATIKSLLAQASEVVHAGDADREGQMIVDEVINYVGFRKSVKRVWLQELNPQGIRKAFQRMKPNSEYQLLSFSATARSRADYLVGMNATRGYTRLWQSAGNEGMVNVGRVQTPTLWLVWQRENERATFEPVDHYGLKVDLAHVNGSFEGVWLPHEGADFLDAEGRVLSKAAAAAVLRSVHGQAGMVETITTEAKKESQPLPYTLLGLQKAASKLGLRPNETLEVVQSLYEIHKIVSYPRSDNPYLPEEDHGLASSVVASVQANFAPDWPFRGTLDMTIKSPAWNDKELGAHFGIIPTVGKKSVSQLTAMEKAVYGMVVRRYLAQFMPAHEYDATIALMTCKGESFKSTGRIVREAGWKVLYELPPRSSSSNAANEGKEDKRLPDMAEKDSVVLSNVTLQEKRTVAPPLLDSASLLDAMKDVHKYVQDPKVKRLLKDVEGLGTEATRGNIISYLVSRGYVEEVPKAKGKDVEYVTTEKGRALLAIVQEQLARPDLTAWFEGQLEGIRQGTTTLERFEAAVVRFIVQMVERLKAPEALSAVPKVHDPDSRPCPKCSGRLKVRQVKETNEQFWGCRAYPNCRHTEEFVKERDGKKRSLKTKPGIDGGKKVPGIRRALPKGRLKSSRS